MTREEAIKMLMDGELNPCVAEDREACDMAIKALEQEPCEDCISRQEVEKITWEEPSYTDALNALTEVREKVRALPLVTPHYTDAEIQKMQELEQAEIQKAYELGKAEQPKIGWWIEDAKTYYEELIKKGLRVDEYTPYFTDDIACSECLAKYSMLDNETQFFKYCPNCGAKM